MVQGLCIFCNKQKYVAIPVTRHCHNDCDILLALSLISAAQITLASSLDTEHPDSLHLRYRLRVYYLALQQMYRLHTSLLHCQWICR